MSHISDILMVILFLMTTFVHLGLIYLIVCIKNKQFLSTNPKPKLLPYASLKNNHSTAAQLIKTGIQIKGFSVFDINKNRFMLNCKVWFNYSNKSGDIEHLDKFNFLYSHLIHKKLTATIIEGEDIYQEYEVMVEFSCIFDHHLFPLNDQSIYLMMVNDYLDVNDFILEATSDNLEIDSNLKVDDWKIISTSIENGFVKNELSPEKTLRAHPRVLYGLHFKKISLRRFFVLIMPLFLITYISNFLQLPLIVHFEGLSVLSLSIGCITTMLGYRYIQIKLSPNVGYSTFSSKMSNFCLIIICFNFLVILGSLLLFGKIQDETFGKLWFFVSKPIMLFSLIYFLYITPKYFQKQKNHPKHQAFLNILNQMQPQNINFAKLHYLNKIKELIDVMHRILQKNQMQLALEKPHSIFILANINSEQTLLNFLDQMIQKNILTDDLVLTHPEDIIIFNQNQLKQPHTVLQLLGMESVLLDKNPKQVFLLQHTENIYRFLKNNIIKLQENSWFNLYEEEILSLILRFLEKLPQYLQLPTEKNTIYIGEAHLNQTLNQCHSIYLFNDDENQLIPEKPAFFLIPQDNAQYCWYLNSGLNHQTHYLEINGEHPQHIMLQSQEQTLFYDLSSGACQSKKLAIIPQNDYQFYSTMDFKQSSSSISKNIYFGLLSQFISRYHSSNPIRILVKNDDYQPTKALSNVEDSILSSSTTPIMLCPVGTPTLLHYRSLIETQKVFVLFPVSGGSSLRRPEIANILYFRASFVDEAKNLIDFAQHECFSKKIALFYEEESFGQSAMTDLKKFLKKLNINWMGFPYARHIQNMKSIAKNIKEYNCDTLIFISTFSASYSLLQEMNLQNLSEINLMAISYAANNLENYLHTKGLKLIRTHLVPPLNSNIEIVKNYHEARAQMPFPNFACDEGLEGFIIGDLINQMLWDTNFSRDPREIKAYFEQFKNYQYKGLNLNFNPQTQELHNQIWLDKK